MVASRQRPDRTALDLVEEAARLLRRAPVSALLSYYLGAIPCLLGLLFFSRTCPSQEPRRSTWCKPRSASPYSSFG